MKFIYLYLILLAFSYTMKAQSYKIITRNEAIYNHIRKKDYKLYKNIDYNSSSVYKLEEQSIYCLLSPEGKYAFIFDDKEELEEMILSRKYPVPDYETDDISEKFQQEISNIDKSVYSFIEGIGEKYHLKLELNYESIIKLNKYLNQIGIETLENFDKYCVGLFLTETFRVETQSFWKADLVFTLNTYWVPYIQDKKGKDYAFVGKIFEDIQENNFIDLEAIYTLELARFYDLVPFSKEYAEFVKSRLSNK